MPFFNPGQITYIYVYHTNAFEAEIIYKNPPPNVISPILCCYSGTSPYGHLTSKKTSQLQSPWLSPKLYSTVQITPCNKVISPLRSLSPSPVGDVNSEVPLYFYFALWLHS